ncbi:MAG: sulfate ABC transporter permease subunit CysW [Pedosphaera sp.]|nr:sulfate ABC transporter permease subunit CysW [Pedosphaera sp.]
MAGSVRRKLTPANTRSRRGADESRLTQWILISVAAIFVGLFLVLPLVSMFYEAFRRGPMAYFAALTQENTLDSIRYTLTIALLVVPLNALFGMAAAWALTRFQFRGKALLTTLIDLPFAISPVVVGVMLIALFGYQGWLGPWLREHDLKVVFALPGMVLATVFVTFPFVARELIPMMQSQGTEPEQAALTLGASGWQVFWHVTLPSIKWALLYGLILTTARAMGEFGAVFVVSNRIAGEMPIPLWVDNLNADHRGSDAFAVASLLAFLALGTLMLKAWLESRHQREEAAGMWITAAPVVNSGESETAFTSNTPS